MTKRTEAEWRDLVEQYITSGLPQEQWCKQNGVNVYTLRDRLNKLKKVMVPAMPDTMKNFKQHQEPDAEPISWLPITQSNSMESAKPVRLEVTIGDFTILVPPVFHRDMFSEVCKALMSLC